MLNEQLSSKLNSVRGVEDSGLKLVVLVEAKVPVRVPHIFVPLGGPLLRLGVAH